MCTYVHGFYEIQLLPMNYDFVLVRVPILEEDKIKLAGFGRVLRGQKEPGHPRAG